jgi:hypothetical protein
VKRIREWIQCGDRRVCSNHVGVRGRFGKTQHYRQHHKASLNLNFDEASSAQRVVGTAIGAPETPEMKSSWKKQRARLVSTGEYRLM